MYPYRRIFCDEVTDCLTEFLKYFLFFCDSDMAVSVEVGVGLNVIRHNQEVCWNRVSKAQS